MDILPKKLSLDEQEKNSLVAEESLINTVFFCFAWFFWFRLIGELFFLISFFLNIEYNFLLAIFMLITSTMLLFYIVLKARLPGRIKRTYSGISEKALAIMFFVIALIPIWLRFSEDYSEGDDLYINVILILIVFIYAAYKSIFQRKISIFPMSVAILPCLLLLKDYGY